MLACIEKSTAGSIPTPPCWGARARARQRGGRRNRPRLLARAAARRADCGPAPVSQNRSVASNQPPYVTFWTHTGLAVTLGARSATWRSGGRRRRRPAGARAAAEVLRPTASGSPRRFAPRDDAMGDANGRAVRAPARLRQREFRRFSPSQFQAGQGQLIGYRRRGRQKRMRRPTVGSQFCVVALVHEYLVFPGIA